MASDLARRVVLARRPVGEPKLEDFRMEEFAVPEPQDGEILLRTIWLSLDPYMRGRMSDGPSYVPPVEIDAVMEGATVAEVVNSKRSEFKSGEIVLARGGWQEFSISDGTGLRKIDPSRAPISTALGVLGMPGMTAYTGLLMIGNPKKGETVVVAAAAGAVGSAVGQIAKIKGARAIGIAGGIDKCKYVTDVLGFDDCIDHRAPDFAEKLKASCPNGIDVYFENVGGDVFSAVYPLLNSFARVPVCGLIAGYNAIPGQGGPVPAWSSSIMWHVLVKRLTLRGFIVSDFASHFPEFIRDMSKWVGEDAIKYMECVAEGLENAPSAFIGMLRGANVGKQLVRISQE